MADERTYSQDEHIAILDDRVKRETADLTAERDQLKSEKAELETKLDVEIANREAAEKRAEEAEKSLEDFKAEIEAREVAEARKDERIGKLREAASHLSEDYFKDEARVQRIVAMDEDAFGGFLSDLSEAAKSVKGASGDTPPRETAMTGAPVSGGNEQPAKAGRTFLMRDYVIETGA